MSSILLLLLCCVLDCGGMKGGGCREGRTGAGEREVQEGGAAGVVPSESRGFDVEVVHRQRGEVCQHHRQPAPCARKKNEMEPGARGGCQNRKEGDPREMGK